MNTGHTFLALLLIMGFTFTPTRGTAQSPSTVEGIQSRIRLRLIDRASVRVVGLSGAPASTFVGRHTEARRVVADVEAVHGTGAAVDAHGLILTARHVTEGADFVICLFPGSDDPVPAKIVYVDPFHDISLLKADRDTPDHLTVPAQAEALTLAERLYSTGYPLDIRERFPAAVSGDLSRENNDGSLQTAMSLNPGNSGGPVIDGRGTLVGVVSRRGAPERGIEGLAFLEPLRFVIPAYQAARSAMLQQPPTFRPLDTTMAHIVADFVRTNDEHPIWEQTALPTVEAAANGADTPEAAMIVAAHAWNMHIALLEDRRAREIADLNDVDRETAQKLQRWAIRLSQQALERAPYVRVHYPVLRSIVNSQGRSAVPDPDEGGPG